MSELVVAWQTPARPDAFVLETLRAEASDIPPAVVTVRRWRQSRCRLDELDVDEELVATHDLDPVHRRRRDDFVAAIERRERLLPLIALGAERFLVDGYARLRALRLLGIAVADVLVQCGADRAVCVVVDDRRRLLVVRRVRNGRRYCVLPGGGVEPSESPRDAAIRELREETGLVGTVLHPLWTVEHADRRAHYFSVDATVGPLRLGGPERDAQGPDNRYELVWIALDDLDAENLQPVDLRARLDCAQINREPPPDG